MKLLRSIYISVAMAGGLLFLSSTVVSAAELNVKIDGEARNAVDTSMIVTSTSRGSEATGTGHSVGNGNDPCTINSTLPVCPDAGTVLSGSGMGIDRPNSPNVIETGADIIGSETQLKKLKQLDTRKISVEPRR